MRRLLGLFVSLLLALAQCDSGGNDGDDGESQAQMHELQFLSTHNSYKIEPEPALIDALRGILGDDLADEFEYSHRPLDEQLDLGVRQVELDVFVDVPDGGHYAEPIPLDLLDLEPMHPDFSEPGLKAMHVQEVDYRSTCPLLSECLSDVQSWSAANPEHLPITIQIEPKDGAIPDPLDLGFVEAIPWSTDAFVDLEEDIAAVFSEEQIITPADVLGDASSLREAVASGDGSDHGWPTLDDARGKVMFTLDHTGDKRELYRGTVPEVADRLIFVDARPPDDEAAIAVVNNPLTDAAEIGELAEAGLIVRTRADADTHQARSGDTTQREAAWASGAHFITTDYIEPDPRFGTGYKVEVPGGGVARCNPITATENCDDAALTE